MMTPQDLTQFFKSLSKKEIILMAKCHLLIWQEMKEEQMQQIQINKPELMEQK